MKIDKPISYAVWSGREPYEVNLTYRTFEVIRGNHIIRMQWSPELAHDLEQIVNINVEQELISMLSMEIERNMNTHLQERLLEDNSNLQFNGYIET